MLFFKLHCVSGAPAFYSDELRRLQSNGFMPAGKSAGANHRVIDVSLRGATPIFCHVRTHCVLDTSKLEHATLKEL